MKKLLTVLSFLALVSFSCFGQVDEEYNKTLKKMLKVSGTNEAFIKQMFTSFRKQYSNVERYPNVNSDMINKWEKEFSETSLNELTEILAPAYAKYMTLEDLQGLIKFYKTPVGRKYAKSTPLIAQESADRRQLWERKMAGMFLAKVMEVKN